MKVLGFLHRRLNDEAVIFASLHEDRGAGISVELHNINKLFKKIQGDEKYITYKNCNWIY